MFKLFTMLAALVMFTGTTLSAQKPTSVNKAMYELVNRYNGKASVECVITTNGSGLQLIKIILYLDSLLLCHSNCGNYDTHNKDYE